jgi:hypothetical protein
MFSLSCNLGVIFGAWSVYNATHPTRQNNVANLAVNQRKYFLLRIPSSSLSDCYCLRCFNDIKIFNQS